MTKRIFNSISAVSISIIAVVMAILMGILYNYFSLQQQHRLQEETEIIARSVELMGMDFLQEMDVTSVRVTWIDSQGKVIFDSHWSTETMENHREREEIIRAINSGYGYSRRYSDTLTEKYLYSAQKLKDSSIIRLSVSQRSIIDILFSMRQPVCLLIAMAVFVSLLLATQLSKSIITPLNNINLDNPAANANYDELSPLLKRIDSQQKEIKLQTYELQRKKDELDTIVGSMNEGIVLLKANRYVITINDTARKILGIQGRAINKLFSNLCSNTAVEAAIDKASDGSPSEYIIRTDIGVYRLNASPVLSENKVIGTALLFFDITEKEKSERMRREFTANVSHELKSPLHAIAGYSELIMNGITTPRDTIAFSQRINSEAKRMNNIIQDIITLSHLDEGMPEITSRPVELYSMAAAVINDMAETAARADVSIELSGEKTTVKGVLPLLQSTLHNLCENAVKYNNPGGSVKVHIENKTDTAVISVQDTGIGIAQQEQEKVFQRFYRVDKSHSREKGGSGLGLSIVKHAVKIHNGKIEIESRPGKGTKITVILPKENI